MFMCVCVCAKFSRALCVVCGEAVLLQLFTQRTRNAFDFLPWKCLCAALVSGTRSQALPKSVRNCEIYARPIRIPQERSIPGLLELVLCKKQTIVAPLRKWSLCHNIRAPPVLIMNSTGVTRDKPCSTLLSGVLAGSNTYHNEWNV